MRSQRNTVKGAQRNRIAPLWLPGQGLAPWREKCYLGLNQAQFRTQGQSEGVGLAAFAGSDAYRWMYNVEVSPANPEWRWHRSRSLRMIVSLLVVLVLGSIALLAALHLR